MSARRIFIAGHVQGVFFRAWTVSRAREIGVTGWVRNRKDGRVEVHAQGKPRALDRLIEKLREGSPASRVESVRFEDAEREACEGFVQRETR